jgi:Cytochrome c oxidase subunit IV
MPEEVRFFGRLSLYAVAAGLVYWFLSYETAGTVLLLGFGIATGVAFLALRGSRRRSDDGAGDEQARMPDGPFGDESAPIPTRSAAPLAVGFGIAVIGLAGAFGPWFAIAGAVPLLVGAADWLRAANHELDQRTRADAAADLATGHATDRATDHVRTETARS